MAWLLPEELRTLVKEKLDKGLEADSFLLKSYASLKDSFKSNLSTYIDLKEEHIKPLEELSKSL